MPQQVKTDQETTPRHEAAPEWNEVRLQGKVSTGPTVKTLPSGSEIVTVRIVVPRASTAMTRGSKQTSDWIDCVAWQGRVCRSLLGWQVGDLVEVEGALRRRFYRGGATTQTRLEVEVLGGRRVSRR